MTIKMNILDINLIKQYKNKSQQARIITEKRTSENIFCPNCWDSILQYENNRPVADFYCETCKEEYELKSGKSLWNKITAWAYLTMINRINSNKNPNFFFLNYSSDYKVKNFFVIPKYYFIEQIIEKRIPLKNTARRAWRTWCNIVISSIPESWKIFYIKDGIKIEKNIITKNWEKTLFLQEQKSSSKWWLLDIMKCIESINRKEFSLQELYNFEEILKEKYPQNNFIKDKIRQQLQILRNKWYLEFSSPWKYKIL